METCMQEANIPTSCVITPKAALLVVLVGPRQVILPNHRAKDCGEQGGQQQHVGEVVKRTL